MGKNTKDHINETMNDSVADQAKIPSVTDAISKLGITMQMAFIDADAFIADPYALLGNVIQIRKNGGKCPVSLNDPGFPVELTAFPIPRKVNESSKLKKPELRQSIIVDSSLATSVAFLSYLSAELNANTSFSLMVFDQAAGLVDMTDKDWKPAVEQWKKDNADLMDDPEICYLFAITGFIQKNIVRKKYVKYSGKAKGGAFGVNINGELSTSTEDYSLDVKFGLTPIVLKRPGPPPPAKALGISKTKPKSPSSISPTKGEFQLFNSMGGRKLIGKKIKHVPAKKKK